MFPIAEFFCGECGHTLANHLLKNNTLRDEYPLSSQVGPCLAHKCTCTNLSEKYIEWESGDHDEHN